MTDFETNFGPKYPKIQTVFKRDADNRNVIIPWAWTTPELEYLSESVWTFTEKIDGTNIRFHWDGTKVTIGGRTDNAQIPAPLLAALNEYADPIAFANQFGDEPATVFGEGFGAGIQKGGDYGAPDFICFDVLVGKWWLKSDQVEDVASHLGVDTVPIKIETTLTEAIEIIADFRPQKLVSQWKDVDMEGLVGTPRIPLLDRNGDRIIAKIKARDWVDYRKHTEAS